MWATLALASALSCAPAQSGELELKNVRVTYGPLGQERKEATKLLPGDLYVISFDIDNLKVADDGRILYSIALELTDKAGKLVYRREPKELEVFNSQGGGRVPANSTTAIGTETPTGEYKVKLIVTDRAARKSVTLERPFEVVPARLGLVQLNLNYYLNNEGFPITMPAPPVAVPGQAYLVNFAVVGFDLDPKTKQPHVAAEIRILDEAGKPTLAKPFSGEVQSVGEEAKKVIPMTFILALSRTGKFKIELKVTDKIANKSVTEALDFTVLEPGK